MHVPTKVRLAVNTMIDLALREDQGPVALSAVSARLRVSLSYLEQIVASLREARLVQAVRGPGGGYSLSRSAQSISVADIVAAVDEQMPGSTGTTEPAGDATELWNRLDEALRAHMAGISLDSLVSQERERGVVVEPRRLRRAIRALPAPAPLRSRAPNSVFAFGLSFAT